MNHYTLNEENKSKIRTYYPNMTEEEFDNIALNSSTTEEMTTHLELGNVELWSENERIIESDTPMYRYTERGSRWITSRKTESMVCDNLLKKIWNKIETKDESCQSIFDSNDFIDATNEEKQHTMKEMLRALESLIDEKSK